MKYVANVETQGDCLLIEFPDCPGCQTFASPGENPEDVAREALEGWLEAALIFGDMPSQPINKSGPKTLTVEISKKLASEIAACSKLI